MNGILLLWYHCDGTGPTWAVPEQPQIAAKEWVFRGQTEHFVDAHIQVALGKHLGHVWGWVLCWSLVQGFLLPDDMLMGIFSQLTQCHWAAAAASRANT